MKKLYSYALIGILITTVTAFAETAETGRCTGALADKTAASEALSPVREIWKQLSGARKEDLDGLIHKMSSHLAAIAVHHEVAITVDLSKKIRISFGDWSFPISNTRGILEVLERSPEGGLRFEIGADLSQISDAFQSVLIQGKLPKKHIREEDLPNQRTPFEPAMSATPDQIALNKRILRAETYEEVNQLLGGKTPPSPVNYVTGFQKIAAVFNDYTNPEAIEATSLIREKLREILEDERLKSMLGPRNLTGIIVNLSRLGIKDVPLISGVCRQGITEIEEFSVRDVTTMAENLGDFDFAPAAFVEALGQRAVALEKSIGDLPFAKFLRDLAVFSYFDESLLKIAQRRFTRPSQHVSINSALSTMNLLIQDQFPEIQFPMTQHPPMIAPGKTETERVAEMAAQLGVELVPTEVGPFVVLLANEKAKVGFDFFKARNLDGSLRGRTRLRRDIIVQRYRWKLVSIHGWRTAVGQDGKREYLRDLFERHLPLGSEE